MSSRFLTRLGSLAVLLVLFSCATVAPTATGGPPVSEPGRYSGEGADASPLRAMNLAKMDAVKKYLKELLGAQYEVFQDKIQRVILSSTNPNQFVVDADMTVVTRSSDPATGASTYVVTVPVRTEDLKATLRALDIRYDGYQADGKTSAATTSAPVAPKVSLPEDPQDAPASATEQKFIKAYIDTLVSMVLFDPLSKLDPAVLRAGLAQSNRWLSENNYDLVDQSQVEKLKADQKLVYQNETKGEVSLQQWIAQKLNAGLYYELSAVPSVEKSDTGYLSQMNLTIKCFDPSTAEMLASVSFNSPKVLSATSALDAQIKTIQPAVWQALPVVVDQVRAKLAKNLVRGVKYDVIIQKSSDQKLISQFRKKLEAQVKLLKTVSASPEETRLEVFYFGKLDSLSDLIERVSGSVPGLEDLYMVMLRGRSLTFNTGL